jgi:CheY-like chemotaxis protein
VTTGDPQKTILVIDDSDDFREIFSTQLSGAGYRVETASNGKDGIEKIKALKPDLVLLDVKMPDMDGEAVLTMIRRDPSISFINVVFTTSLGDAGDELTVEALAKKSGADGYIRKTDDLGKITALVANYLKK